MRVNQQTNGGQWNLLGTFDFQDQGSVVVSDDVSSGQDVVADAVRLVYLGPSCDLPGDLNCDCVVDIVDIMLVASLWNCECGNESYDPRYDLDGDCDIDVVDVMLVTARWGNTC